MNTTTAYSQLEKLFAPDIRVKLNETDKIEAAEALTRHGANFVLKYPLLGVDYDTALFASEGLTFEQA